MLARIGNSDVVSLLSRVIQDLVRGMFFFQSIIIIEGKITEIFFRRIYAIINQRK